MRRSRAAAAVFVLLLACNEEKATTKPSPKPSASTPVALSPPEEAKQLVTNRCSMCHGASGHGDGPTAATLNPKPRDFSSREWQKSISDGQIRTVILQGGVGVGKSALMPPNQDLADKPAVVEELVRIVRSY